MIALVLLALPCVVPPATADGAALLKAAGIETLCAPAEVAGREVLLVPGIRPRGVDRVSATRSPWVNANGWRFRREPGRKWLYKLPAGSAALAAAEAFAQGGEAALEIDAADAPKLAAMLSFLSIVPPRVLPDVADVAVVDNRSPFLPEVLNLLARRNLLFKLVPQPSPEFRTNVVLGSPEYPERDAADPSAFALKIRRQHTDEQRAFRIFGSEGIIGRLTADGRRVRLHLLNYSGRELEGLRVRIRGLYPNGEALLPGAGRVPLEDYTQDGGATEFTLPRLGVYGIVDLPPEK